MNVQNKWENEPDRLEFMHCGIACIVIRHPSMGHLCGYVKVDRDHPVYGFNYERMSEYFNVHGGLTYSGHLESEDHWYFGFDCGHSGDLVPSMVKMYFQLGLAMEPNLDFYRDIEYVSNEVREMAESLHENRLKLLFV